VGILSFGHLRRGHFFTESGIIVPILGVVNRVYRGAPVQRKQKKWILQSLSNKLQDPYAPASMNNEIIFANKVNLVIFTAKGKNRKNI
jgi:hypothetical protein